MESNDVRDSPYIANFDLVPPSPAHSHLEFEDFDPAFAISESNQQLINPLTSPGYANTPSYPGSHFNSPYSQHSDLPELDFFDFPTSTTATSGMNDYEPSEYDAPTQGNSLLMFPGDTDFMSPHLSPSSGGPDGHRGRGSPFDYGSPASSPGIDDNNHGGRHSRASSVASNQPSPSAQQPGTHSPQPPFNPSPRLDVVHSFGNMTVRTPNWSSQPLPNVATESLPSQKPQSPPRLTMPSGMTFDSEPTAVPKINAPDGDHDVGGPSFNIVPATPVTGGDATGRQHIPFQRTLATLNQGVELHTDTEQQQQHQPQQQQTQQRASPYASPHIIPTSLVPSSLYPEEQEIRQRRNSDGWPGPSFDISQNQLDSYGFQQQQQQPQLSHPIDEQHRQQLQSFTFGGNSGGPNNYLTTGGDAIRRTVSDSLAAPRIHRQSRSEEIRPLPAFATPVGFQAHHGQSNSMSTSGPFLFPPTSHTDFIQRQQQQFLHPNDLPSAPSVPGLQPPHGRRSLSPMGHYRRASSGSRSGRGAEVWGTQADHLPPSSVGIRRMSPYPTPSASPRVNYAELDDLNDLSLGNQNLGLGNTAGSLGAGLGLSVGVSSVGAEGIPGIGEPPVSAGYSEEVAITGRNTYNQAGGGGDGASSHRAESVHSVSGGEQGPIAKQNVTTGRTANASIRRRKQEATFVCKVPGCGSTFTRGFNLKGHMRSHYEQKPYKCHWPGCDKGFARQHDCKRHEQLHSNYRPFVCDGCGKNFARMDALNRHLRSEAGAECARAVEEKREGGDDGVLDGNEQQMEEDDEKKPLVENPAGLLQPRRRNTNNMGGSGIGNSLPGLPDELWSVAL